MSKRAIFDKKNILITGGAGFIGSHLCDELIRDNKVICVDNFISGSEKNIDHLLAEPNFEFIKHDITKPFDLESFPELQKFKIQFQGVQEIYNLACPTSPMDFDKLKIETLLVNSLGIKNVLDVAHKYDSKLLHFSSSVVYGSRINISKVPEEQNGTINFLSNRSSYDEGKRFAETFVKNYRDQYGIDAKTIRLFRTFGPRMKIGVGHIVADYVSNALLNEDIQIYGDDKFATSLMYVSDCVDAAVKIMGSNINEPINIGSDIDIKLTEVAEKIIKYTKSSSKIKFVKKHPFITPLCLPDISKARNELGWLPIATLDHGLKLTIDDLQAGRGLKNVAEAL